MKSANNKPKITTFKDLENVFSDLYNKENSVTLEQSLANSSIIRQKVQDFQTKKGINIIKIEYNSFKVAVMILVKPHYRYRIIYNPDGTFSIRVSAKRIVPIEAMFRIISNINYKKQTTNAKPIGNPQK